MSEPHDLAAARRRLAQAEDGYGTDSGLAQLVEGIELLDDVIAGGDARHAQTARNLAATYADRLFKRVERAVSGDPALPEPDLEHCFRVVLAFDRVDADLPASAAALKIAVVRRLIDRYYEGHPPEAKRLALEQLEQLARSK